METNVDFALFISLWVLGFNNTVVATEVHESKESKQTIIIGIEIAIGRRLVFGIPEGECEVLTLLVPREDRGGGSGGNETYAVTQGLATVACREYLPFIGQRAVNTILINEVVDAFAVEEILYALTVGSLPLSVVTAPCIVEGDIHRYTPRVVAEILTS